jgi:thymidylate synthase (FAD)
MRILEQTAEIIHGPDQASAAIIVSQAAATCFGAHPKDIETHLEGIYKRGHLSVFEHINVVTRLRTDIATYKGLTRHRHCAFTIESTHYKSYKDGIAIIRVPDMSEEDLIDFFTTVEYQHKLVFDKYGKMVARSFLPQAQAADMTMTTNLREWFHIFDLRKGTENTTNMWKLMELILAAFRIKYPFFMYLYEGHHE